MKVFLFLVTTLNQYVFITFSNTTATARSPLREPLPNTMVHIRKGACQPRDNLGIACVIQNDSSCGEYVYTGRRKSVSMPPDNIGISCLPTSEPERLRDIPEDPEHEYLLVEGVVEEEKEEEDIPEQDCVKEYSCCRCGRGAFRPKDKICGRVAEKNPLPLEIAGKSKDRSANNKRPIRLRGGRSQELPSPSSTIISSACSGDTVYGNSTKCTDTSTEKGNLHRRRKAMLKEGIIPEHEYVPSNTLLSRNAQKTEQMGISNIRRPSGDLTKPRKAVVPRDHLVGPRFGHIGRSYINSTGSRDFSTQFSHNHPRKLTDQ